MMQHRPWHDHYDTGVPAEIDIPDHPLHAFLEENARHAPQQVCCRFNGSELTYAEVNTLSDRVARLLAALQLETGEPVGICMPNIPQFIITYFGVLKAGGVVTAINPRFGPGELRTLLADVQPRIVFAACGSEELLEHMRAYPSIESIFLTAPDDAPLLAQCLAETIPYNPSRRQLIDLLKMEAPAALPVVTAEEDCIYQYSGGTTGTPKAAAATHRSLVANTLQFRAWLTPLETGRECTLVAIPLYHVYGMVIGMCVSLALRSVIVLHDERKGLAGMLNLIETESCTLFPAVPYLLEVMLLQPAVTQRSISLDSLKVIISGASPLRVQCLQAYQELLKGRLVEGYGLSEAPTATHCNPVQGDIRPGTIGLPLPGVDARIVSLADGVSEMPVGEIGELILRSPQVMRGYLNRPQESELVLRGGWLYTGDIARMDADGYFTIVDRKKDLIKVSGFQVWPYEVESVLTHHPAIRESGVVGVEDTLHGEKVVAWLVLEQGETIDLETVQTWCKRRLAAYKTPREIRFCEALPRSALGKLLRRELRQMTIEGS
ncbi:MAG: AMP-binding protein [Anaerolineae bacterium]|nr:AMP-binding protein [Anaerolineae bacterium]